MDQHTVEAVCFFIHLHPPSIPRCNPMWDKPITITFLRNVEWSFSVVVWHLFHWLRRLVRNELIFNCNFKKIVFTSEINEGINEGIKFRYYKWNTPIVSFHERVSVPGALSDVLLSFVSKGPAARVGGGISLFLIEMSQTYQECQEDLSATEMAISSIVALS